MDEALFNEKKAALDAELAAISTNALVGIKLGRDLYTEFKRQGLLVAKEADLILTKWWLWMYQDRFFVFDSPDVADDDFKVGDPNAPRS